MINIKKYLEENNFEVISTIASEIIIAYNFDLVEMDAAKSFLNTEEIISKEDKEKEYQQYLEEIASDNLEDTLDEILEELDIKLSFEVQGFAENKQFFVIKK
ncbi:MAG: hypothetical protein ACRCTZ_10990 [Sarcina sp.]